MSAERYIQELQRESDVLDSREFQHAVRLLQTEIHNVGANNDERYEVEPQPKNRGFNELQQRFDEEIVKLSEKIILPVEEYPRYNFVRRLLGTKGSTMKAIQEISKTKISILGKGSTRDREKEEELSKSDDPRHEHFKEPLHIIISVEAYRSEAHERLANCLIEINKCMDPENNGNLRDHIEERHRHINGFELGRQDRGIGLPTPIIKVGIPPPGAVILNGPLPAGVNGSTRTGIHGGVSLGRGDSRRTRPY